MDIMLTMAIMEYEKYREREKLLQQYIDTGYTPDEINDIYDENNYNYDFDDGDEEDD